MKAPSLILASILAATIGACGDSKTSPTTPTTPTVTPPTLTKPSPDVPADGQQLDTLRPTLSVNNGTSDQTGTRTYEFQIADNASFTMTGSFNMWFATTVSGTGVAEGAGGKTSYTHTQDLQPATRFYWRVRMTQGSVTSEWSDARNFKTKLVGYSRPGELYDPLIHGETVGQLVGQTTFIAGKGIRLDNSQSHVKYLLPEIVSNGEFSMDVEGLAANSPGDKAKVFSMQEGQGDFILNRYRVDIQYRGTSGVPPNAIQWRVLYGSATDLSVRYEPGTAKRMASVFLLDPATKYHWKATWGTSFRLVVLQNGIGGSPLYDYGLPTPNGRYTPNPHYAYLGAPVSQSSSESASIANTVYSNVWLGKTPRPASLGSALEIER